MPQIKKLSDSSLATVAVYPVLVNGIWECGDRRFTDPDGTQYAPVGYPPLLVNAGRFYSLFSNQQQQDIEASTDAVVKQFLKNVNVLVASGDQVDLGSSAVQAGLGYLAITDVQPAATPARKYIAGADIPRISQNLLP